MNGGGTLVGRRAEVERLTAAFASLAPDRGAVAVVAGAPGIGKTRLLDELARRIDDDRAVVLHGRASEFERSFPFGVFVDALDDYLRSQPDQVLDRLGAAAREEYALIFPSLRRRLPAQDAPPAPEDRVRAYFAIRSLLEELAVSGPLVLVLDDLHWADRGSVELLAHLIRRPPARPVLIVAAYRPQQVDADLAATVARAASEGAVTVVEPAPLSRAEAEQLVGAAGEQADRLHQLSGGNPFLLLELARSGAPTDVTDGDRLPQAIADAIVRELDPLPGAARALADAAAVAGDPFDFDLAAAAVDLPEPEALVALDAIAAHGLVRRTDVPRRFAFRHPLVRHAVYAGLLPGRRLQIHERCAALLRGRGAAPAEIAHHVEHAARPSDEAAIDLLASAATEVASRAPASAVRWLYAALRLLPPEAPAEDRLRLLEPLPPLLLSLGDLQAARDALAEALELVPATDPTRRTRLATAAAAVDQLLGRHDDAHARLERTLAGLPAGADREGVSILIALVMDCFYRSRPDEMTRCGRDAVEVATRVGHPPLMAAAHAARCLAAALSGAVPDAEVHREVAARLVDEMTDAELGERLDAIGMLAGAELYLDRFHDSARHAERGLRVGRAAGTTFNAPMLVPSLGTSLWVLGRIAEARDLLDESVESARAARDEQALAWRLFNLAFPQLLMGDLAAGLRSSTESLGIASRIGDGALTTWAGVNTALGRFESGEPDAALRVMRETAGADLERVPGGWRAYFLDLAAQCWLAVDRPDRAREQAASARGVADRVGLPFASSLAARAEARVALATADPATAVERARTAVAEAERAQARLDAERARVVLGQALAAAGAVEEAAAELATAAAELDAMGATRYRDEAERGLGRLGRRPHRRTRRGAGEDGVASLTDREREIALLVVDRHTNPEIAARLFLSTKTVETHLRNVFRKVGVSSRTELARVLEAQQPG